MSRRKSKQSTADELFEVVIKGASVIPWWATTPVALLLFFFVPYGSPTQVGLLEPSNIVYILLGVFIKALFKFLIPFALVIGGAINIFSSIKSFTLFQNIKSKGARETVEGLSWQDFEFLLSEWFKKDGFSTELTGGGGADGGIDIKLYKDNELYLVQCKHYKAWKVSVNIVRELFGVMTAENAVGGYVVTSGKFTKEAKAFAEDKSIVLIDGSKLDNILDSNIAPERKSSTQKCPKCNSDLVERKGKYGTFLGCSTYPNCKYTETVK